MSELKLCYVKEPWAYFTTQDLDKQWGDDWNDAPYEHNAGEPYAHNPALDKERWEICKVAYDGDFETPCTDVRNSSFSVQQINAGAIAWLRTSRWQSGKSTVIPAGTELSEFIKLVSRCGGTVYLGTNNKLVGDLETKLRLAL